MDKTANISGTLTLALTTTETAHKQFAICTRPKAERKKLTNGMCVLCDGGKNSKVLCGADVNKESSPDIPQARYSQCETVPLRGNDLHVIDLQGRFPERAVRRKLDFKNRRILNYITQINVSASTAVDIPPLSGGTQYSVVLTNLRKCLKHQVILSFEVNTEQSLSGFVVVFLQLHKPCFNSTPFITNTTCFWLIMPSKYVQRLVCLLPVLDISSFFCMKQEMFCRYF